MYVFFVSVGPGETRWALYYTLSTLSTAGRVYVHFDTWEEYWRHKEVVDQYADTVVLARRRTGLAQGRSWAVEELPDMFQPFLRFYFLSTCRLLRCLLSARFNPS